VWNNVNGSNGPLRTDHANAINENHHTIWRTTFYGEPDQRLSHFHLSVGKQKTPTQFQSRPATQYHYNFAAGVVACQLRRGIAAAPKLL
jgi:hypothetical protein